MNDIKLAQKFISKQQSSEVRGIPFDLSFVSFKNLMRAKKCYYTGIKLTDPKSSNQISTDRTIDRVDSTKGYTKGNVVACCYEVNQLKSQLEKKPKLVKQIIRKSKIL